MNPSMPTHIFKSGKDLNFFLPCLKAPSPHATNPRPNPCSHYALTLVVVPCIVIISVPRSIRPVNVFHLTLHFCALDKDFLERLQMLTAMMKNSTSSIKILCQSSIEIFPCEERNVIRHIWVSIFPETFRSFVPY